MNDSMKYDKTYCKHSTGSDAKWITHVTLSTLSNMDLAIYEGQVPLQWTHILNSEPRCNYMPTL